MKKANPLQLANLRLGKFAALKVTLKHGMCRTAEYRAWSGMRDRCNRKGNAAWRYYGGRGITVCERWQSFENFLQDMGLRPSRQHSIDRINTDGNYEPGNCRWATKKEQSNNSRANNIISFQGQQRTLAEWADHTGIPRNTIKLRQRRGWPIERMLSEPPRPQPSRSARMTERHSQ